MRELPRIPPTDTIWALDRVRHSADSRVVRRGIILIATINAPQLPQSKPPSCKSSPTSPMRSLSPIPIPKENTAANQGKSNTFGKKVPPMRITTAMERDLPSAERRNDKGACWTCLDKDRTCDGRLPRKFTHLLLNPVREHY